MGTLKPFVFQKKHTETRHNKLFTCAKTFNRLFMAVDRDCITSRLLYDKIFCTTLFWCSVKRPSVISVGRIWTPYFFPKTTVYWFHKNVNVDEKQSTNVHIFFPKLSYQQKIAVTLFSNSFFRICALQVYVCVHLYYINCYDEGGGGLGKQEIEAASVCTHRSPYRCLRVDYLHDEGGD